MVATNARTIPFLISRQANRNIAVKANIVYCDKISIPSDSKNGMTIICFYIVLQIFFPKQKQ